MAFTRARVIVRGIVQGVGFRYWTERRAQALGLNGWVRNLPDGSVEVLLEGEETIVGEMIEALHRGPPLSQVQKTDFKFEPYIGEFKGFSVR